MDGEYKFVNSILEYKIKTIVVPSMFVSLNTKHREILCKYVIRLINIIAIFFCFDNEWFPQLEQNNYQDIKWLLVHLLPFLNEFDNIAKLESLDDIYIKKKKNVNINEEEPEYIYSNLQYNRCNRDDNNYTERKFSLIDLKQNFYLLVNTIKIMANKMHVNWIDILPFTMLDYKSSILYINTNDKIQNNLLNDLDLIKYCDCDYNINENEDDICEKITIEYGTSLSMEDIYNCICNDLYSGIKNIKWLIYDIPINKSIVPIIVILNKLFNLNYCLKGVNWNNLQTDEQTKFERTWNNIIETSISGNDIIYNNIYLSTESTRLLLKGIIFTFDKTHHLVEDAVIEDPVTKNKYIKILKSIDDNKYNEDDDETGKITFFDVIASLKSVMPKYIYTFFYEALQKIKGTWYGTKLLSDDKLNILDFEYLYTSRDGFNITYKNIYNFSKSLCHYTDENKNYIEYPFNWSSLQKKQKNEILKRLNNKQNDQIEDDDELEDDDEYDDQYNEDNKTDYSITWFWMPNYIEKLGIDKFIGYKTTKDINIAIYKNIKNILARILFETLIIKGVLTRFIPRKEATDQQYISRDKIISIQGKILNPSINNPYWTSSYHYLTMMPYFQMKNFTIKGETYNYFTYGIKKNAWYTAYSYDWVAQIGFCHHFINNRVIFITGATGVGKSTEIPKLFLYYLKAIDYVTAPKVICTQPRKAPTENNAEYVAQGLGLPIYESTYDSEIKTETENYYIQMRHRDSEHFKRTFHSTLEYCTDGTFSLYANDPIMKEKYGDKYNDKNLYDIIMIDESHEHGINMDILLTLLKLPITYNNSLRLVILSATMDEDEPRYRRYYRNINDNRKFPLNTWIEEHQIDRINVDRRYHISPPGIGTKFVVTDIYTPKKTELETVLDILKSSTSGDILLFQSGVNDIKNIIDELNKNIPNDVIALPYHAQLNKNAREFIEKIHENLIILKMDKNEDFNKITNYTTNSASSYKRAIIVATNVAEASITIPSLKFVVETGTQKVQLYDYTKRGEQLIKINISESSRIQRRGRVGRKSSGTVYYLYEKGTMENIKIAYNISTQDLSLILFKYLRENCNELQFIEKKYDPNNYSTKYNINIINDIFKQNGLNKILIKQYFIGGVYYDYFGNMNMYDYKNYNYLPEYYKTGFNYDTLIDSNCNFYLIHPNELQIKRNIGGNVVGTTTTFGDNNINDVIFKKHGKYNGTIRSLKLESFWITLINYMYIQKVNNDMIKTLIGTNFIKLYEDMKMDNHKLFRSIIFSIPLGCDDSILKLSTMYEIVNFNICDICKKIGKKYITEPIIKLVKDKTSDSDALLYILNEFHEFIKQIGVSEKLNSTQYANNMIENNEFRYTHLDYLQLMGPDENYSAELKKKIINYDKKNIIKKINDAFEKIHNKYIEINKTKIYNWCSIRNLDTDIFIKYITKYAKIRTTINKKMSLDTCNFLKLLHNGLKKSKIIDTNTNLILLSFYLGFPFHVCVNINRSRYYLSLIDPLLTNTYQIASLYSYTFLPNTLLQLQNPIYEYILYLSINIESDTITCLHKIDPTFISILYEMYEKKPTETMIKNSIQTFVKNKGNAYKTSKNISNINENVQNAIIGYGKTLNKIDKDFKNLKNKHIYLIVNI